MYEIATCKLSQILVKVTNIYLYELYRASHKRTRYR